MSSKLEQPEIGGQAASQDERTARGPARPGRQVVSRAGEATRVRALLAAGLGDARTRYAVALLGAWAVALLLRLFRLDSLQNEIYDDIGLIFGYTHAIRDGKWPTHFVLSAGPLYHYAIVPVLWLAGYTYYGIKLASVVVSLGVLWATFRLARRLLDERLALLALFVSGVSSWMLVFSRLGNSLIQLPLLTALALWLLVRIVQQGRAVDVILCAVVSSLGLYAYPSAFVLPVAVGAALLCLHWTLKTVPWSHILLFGLTVIICALPFAGIVARDPDNFSSGYVGGKLRASGDMGDAMLGNLRRTLLSLHVRGDDNFRSNPRGMPHLDLVSGVLLLAGVAFWLRPAHRRWSPALFVPLLVLYLPSLLVVSAPGEVPSASRAFGAAPIIYILVASGLYWLLALLRERAGGAGRAGAWMVALLGLAAILGLNAQRYFGRYIAGLPANNTPVGRHIADYIDLLPTNTHAYVVGCCWLNYMPETVAISYAARDPGRVHFLSAGSASCDDLAEASQPAVVIWGAHKPLPNTRLVECADWIPAQLYASPRGLPLFYAAPLTLERPDYARLLSAELVSTTLLLEDRVLDVRHPRLDIGSASRIFDGSLDTLARGRDANPFPFELIFGQPREVGGVALDLAGISRFKVTLEGIGADGQPAAPVVREYEGLPADPHVELDFGEGRRRMALVRVTIDNLEPSLGDVHIHVRELTLR